MKRASVSARIALQILAFLGATLAASVEAASGQTTRLALLAGASQFDLSGTGTAFMAAVRVERSLTSALVVEGGVGWTRPDQQLGATTHLVIPEIGVQLQLAKRVAPYIGVGTGVAMDLRPTPFDDKVDFTLSGAAGVRAALSDAFGLRAELRVRGIDLNTGESGWGFTGTTAEWTGGISWSP